MSDGKTTDAEINAALALKIGWTVNEFGEWVSPVGHPGRIDPPGYLSDPAASADLEDWLHEAGHMLSCHWRAAYVEMRLQLYGVTGFRSHSEWTVELRSASAARMRALAVLAHAALCAPTGGPDER